MTHIDEAIERIRHPESSSLALRLDPVLKLSVPLALSNILGRVNLVQSHQLNQAEAASGANATPLMVRTHKFVDKKQHSRLHMLNVCKFRPVVFGL